MILIDYDEEEEEDEYEEELERHHKKKKVKGGNMPILSFMKASTAPQTVQNQKKVNFFVFDY